MSKVNVIGNGIIGLCCAHSLLQRGIGVRVFGAPDASRAATWGCAGHIAIEQRDPLSSWSSIWALPRNLYAFGGAASFPLGQADVWAPFALKFLAAAQRKRFMAGREALSRLLQRATGSWHGRLASFSAQDLFDARGHLVCWDEPRSFALGTRAWKAKCPPFVKIGELSERDKADLNSLGISVDHAVRFDGSGQIVDLDQLRARLLDAIKALGGEIVEMCVEPRDVGKLRGGITLIAAGWQSHALMRQFGVDVPLISERGYHIEFEIGDEFPDIVPVVFESKSMIMTRFRKSLRFASFVEFGDGRAEPDPAKWRSLERKVEQLGFRLNQARHWSGSRPTLPDYLPAIGKVPGSQSVFYAFGHQHLGLTLGSITGDLMAGLISGSAVPVNLAPYSLSRFSAQRHSRVG